MTDRIIKHGDSSFAIRRQMPDNWVKPGTVTLNIRSVPAGTLIVTAGAVTVIAADTLDGAITRMARSLTLTTGGAHKAGDVLRLGDDTDTFEMITIETVNGTAVTIKGRIKYDWADNTTVSARAMAYSLDASVAGFDDVDLTTFEWACTGDDSDFTEEWQILKRVHDLGHIEQDFSIIHKSPYSQIPNGAFATYEKQARIQIETWLESQGIDVDKMIGMDDEYKTLLMREIAHMAEPTEATANALNDYKVQVRAFPIWIDDDEDLVKDAGEMKKATNLSMLRRNW